MFNLSITIQLLMLYLGQKIKKSLKNTNYNKYQIKNPVLICMFYQEISHKHYCGIGPLKSVGDLPNPSLP